MGQKRSSWLLARAVGQVVESITPASWGAKLRRSVLQRASVSASAELGINHRLHRRSIDSDPVSESTEDPYEVEMKKIIAGVDSACLCDPLATWQLEPVISENPLSSSSSSSSFPHKQRQAAPVLHQPDMASFADAEPVNV